MRSTGEAGGGRSWGEEEAQELAKEKKHLGVSWAGFCFKARRDEQREEVLLLK